MTPMISQLVATRTANKPGGAQPMVRCQGELRTLIRLARTSTSTNKEVETVPAQDMDEIEIAWPRQERRPGTRRAYCPARRVPCDSRRRTDRASGLRYS